MRIKAVTLIPIARNILSLLAAGCLSFSAFAQDPKAEIQKDLEAHYALTQPKADNSDIVTAGAVLVLQKNSIMMVAVSSSTNPYLNTYKGGKITAGGTGTAKKFWDHVPGATAVGPATHTFVRGEKMWVTAISVKDDGIYFDLFSDPIDDVRFKGKVKFPLSYDMPITPQQAEQFVSQVFTVDGGEQTTKAAPGPSAPAPVQPVAAPVAPPPAPVAPPPPPPDEVAPAPPTIALKQTKAQVEASFGQPARKAGLGKKEIYFYKDMKVTFTDGKVTNIE